MKQFYFDKKEIIGRFFYGIVYLLLNIKVWFYKTVGINTKTDFIIGVIAIFIFINYLIRTIWLAIITYRKIPALILSEESIYDYQYGITFFWKDVKKYKLWNNIIVLDMKDPADYIELIRNPVHRIISKAWYLIFRKKKFRIRMRILDTDGGLIFKQFEHYDIIANNRLINI
jgi:hypothetical protein